MLIKLTHQFKKNYKKRILPNPALREKYIERVEIFSQNRHEEILQDHELTGKLRNYRAFSISGDIRIIYLEENHNTILFLDVGTHNQVYR